MRQRKLGSHTPPCHRRMVITTLFSVLLAALQRRLVLYHTRKTEWGGGGVILVDLSGIEDCPALERILLGKKHTACGRGLGAV